MKEYLLLYKGGDPDWMENMGEDDIAEVMEAWRLWLEALESKGQLISGGNPLQNSGKRLSSDGVVTEIAAAELKELVSGYSIISATDYEQAVALTRDCPVFGEDGVTVEIREVIQLG